MKKGGNVVLLSEQDYEQEIIRQLGDQLTYLKVMSNPFPWIVSSLNFKLQLAFKAQLLTRKELNFLTIRDFNTPNIYVKPKVHNSLTRPPGRPIIWPLEAHLNGLANSVML